MNSRSCCCAECGYLMKSNRFWVVVLGGVLLVSILAAFLLRGSPANVAHVYLDGSLIETMDLSAVTDPLFVSIESNLGVNTILIERGRICVSDADCPDRSCVRQGWITGGYIPIVCLPHRLVIRLEGGGAPELDAVVG